MAEKRPRNADVPRNLKPYFLCLLKKGPKWNITEGNEDLMPRYLAYLRQEIEGRRILFAGPVTDEGDLIAIAVLEATNLDAAKAIVHGNPGIETGHFLAELHPCFLPALDAIQVQY